MNLHHPKIAWSVVWGMAGVFFVVLWADSYAKERIVTLGIPGGPGYMIGSGQGELSAALFETLKGKVSAGWDAWTNAARPVRAWESLPYTETFGIRRGSFFVAVPFSYLTLICLAAAMTPLRTWRFGLRPLFAALTGVAIVMGLTLAVLRQLG